MLRRTEGIVLRTVLFGEADLIVTYLTPDIGLLKVFAKSPRKIKSRFGSSLEPLTHAKISFWGREDSPLPRLTQSDIIHPFQSLRDDLNCFLKVSEIIEITMCFIPERDVNGSVYSLLLNTLQTIENNPSFLKQGKGDEVPHRKTGIAGKNLIISGYKIKFLNLAGFGPKLDACGRCGKNGYNFYLSQGAILCESCADDAGSPIKLSAALARFYHDLLTWDTAKIQRIKPSDKILTELLFLINTHIKYILSKSLKTETFNHRTNTV
jgi:DNA repair protein RecO (recombination protein O)